MTPPKLLPLLFVVASWTALRGEVFDIGGHKQLFIDDRFVTQAEGVEWTMNPPQKEGVILRGTDSWDNGYLSAYGTVLDDGGKYRLWYVGGPAVDAARPGDAGGTVDQAVSRLCYAESNDGVHWFKPPLGLYSWRGSKANNILMEGPLENADVLVDPKAPPAERYKLVGRMQQRSRKWPNGNAPEGTGLYIYTSPDGLTWTLHPHRVFPFDCDTLNMALYDDRTGKYLAFVRTWNPWRRVGVVETDDLMRPWPFDASAPRHRAKAVGPPGAVRGEIPDAFGADRDDPPNLDFYTSAVVKYSWAQDAYFMFPSAYRHFPNPKGKDLNDGTLDIDLAVSRGGRKFHRVVREPYIGLGRSGEGDDRTLYLFIGMLRRNNRLYQYYEGNDFTHGSLGGVEDGRGRGAIFLARNRLDGLVSLDAGVDGGRFTTPPLMFQGRHLALNLNTSATGEVRVELQDAAGRPIGIYDYDSDAGVPLGGYTFADSDPLDGNDVARIVTWRRGDGDLSRLAGQPVRLAFRLRSAKLYSFQFTP